MGFLNQKEENMETIVESKKEIGIIINKPVTIRDVLRETLNASYDGHNEGCLNCAEINELVDHFIQDGNFKIYRIKDYYEDSRGRNVQDGYDLGHFARREFAEERVQELKKKDETQCPNASFKRYYEIEEIDVKI